MTRFIARSTFGLVAAIGLFAAPSDVKAQYGGGTSVGVTYANPNFGISVGFGQPQVYRPYYPTVVAPYYPVYSPGYPVYAPRPVGPYAVTPHYTPYRGWHTHGPVPAPYYGHGHGGRY